MFVTQPKFDLGFVICPNIYNMCESEWNASNAPRWFQLYPSLNEAVSIIQIWLGLLEFAQMFLSVCKNNEAVVLHKLEWSCLKLPKVE